MKTLQSITLLAAIAAMPFAAQAQTGTASTTKTTSTTTTTTAAVTPPAAVTQALNTRYPGVTPQWQMQGKYYQANVMADSRRYEVYFAPDGRWIKTNYEMQQSALPQPVQQAWSKSGMTNWRVVGIEHVETPTQPDLYLVKAEQNGVQKKTYYNATGGPVAQPME